MKQALFFLLLQPVLWSCRKPTSPPPALLFDSLPTAKTVKPIINEASGIAESILNPGFIWVEEDSGHPPELSLLGEDGVVRKKVFIAGTTNYDWEDLTLFANDLYIADIGDNFKNRPDYVIYKFAEPFAATDTVKNVQAIRFTYPDGSHDAEAFLIDPVTKDIFIITKQDNPSRIYQLYYPYNATTLSYVGSLSYSGVVSAAMSPDGKEIIVKLYTALYHYTQQPGASIEKTLQTTYTKLPYLLEPQGEAVTFAHANNGFYTLSEKGLGSSVILYFYARR